MTCGNPNRAAAIIDAMAYHAYADILPVYYGVNVEQKQMRNEDSIEMLDIIRGSITYSADLSYGWSRSIAEALRDTITKGDGAVASVIASNLTAAQANIDKMMTDLNLK